MNLRGARAYAAHRWICCAEKLVGTFSPPTAPASRTRRALTSKALFSIATWWIVRSVYPSLTQTSLGKIKRAALAGMHGNVVWPRLADGRGMDAKYHWFRYSHMLLRGGHGNNSPADYSTSCKGMLTGSFLMGSRPVQASTAIHVYISLILYQPRALSIATKLFCLPSCSAWHGASQLPRIRVGPGVAAAQGAHNQPHTMDSAYSAHPCSYHELRRSIVLF